MRTYTIADLKKRYNINSRQGIAQFIQRYIERINIDGEHIKKIAGKWTVDETAVERLDSLRSSGGITIIEEDSEEVGKLKAQNEQLKEMLIAIQNKLIESQENEKAIYRQLSVVQKQLLTTEKQLKDSESKLQEQLATIKVDVERKKQRIAELEKASERAKELEATLDNMRQRSLIDRILNRQ